MPTIPLSTPEPAVKVPGYVYYFLAVVLALVVIVIIQVIYVRVQLSKYSKDDYYKQLMVKNEYVTTQNQVCSNFSVYAWQIDTVLAKLMNENAIRLGFTTQMDLPKYFYTIPTSGSFKTIEYTSSDLYFVPLVTSSIATTRFINDCISQNVDYVSWHAGLFRVQAMQDFKDKMSTYLSSKSLDSITSMLDKCTVIVLARVPSLASLKEIDYALSQELDENAPDSVIHSFVGDSRGEFDASSLANSLHVIGYKV